MDRETLPTFPFISIPIPCQINLSRDSMHFFNPKSSSPLQWISHAVVQSMVDYLIASHIN